MLVQVWSRMEALMVQIFWMVVHCTVEYIGDDRDEVWSNRSWVYVGDADNKIIETAVVATKLSQVLLAVVYAGDKIWRACSCTSGVGLYLQSLTNYEVQSTGA